MSMFAATAALYSRAASGRVMAEEADLGKSEPDRRPWAAGVAARRPGVLVGSPWLDVLQRRGQRGARIMII